MPTLPGTATAFEGMAGLENSTRTLVFTSGSGCRASEYFDILLKIKFSHDDVCK